jgi:hypothetical protein
MYNEFLKLSKQWKEETKILSDSNKIYTNQNYIDIINIGPKAIPFILKDWENSNAHWFHALYKITGENPIHPDNNGNIIKMKEDWINYLTK